MHDLLLPDSALNIAVLHWGQDPVSGGLRQCRRDVRAFPMVMAGAAGDPAAPAAGRVVVPAAGGGVGLVVTCIGDRRAVAEGFDAVVVHDVYAPDGPGGRADLAQVLATVRAILRPGGMVSLTWRNPYDSQRIRAAGPSRLAGLVTGFAWRPGAVVGHLAAAGFRDVHTFSMLPEINCPVKAVPLGGRASDVFYRRFRLAQQSGSAVHRWAIRMVDAVHLRPYLEPAFIAVSTA
ncbi:MAG: hypothetical protein H6907_09770 [Hyphomicrobiales bacterium]|nr:hypothetical protein [Hyphomicrobiales bacterium]MCP5372006.1 hypothetical protein [Hyphomicrobiales bacterium]